MISYLATSAPTPDWLWDVAKMWEGIISGACGYIGDLLGIKFSRNVAYFFSLFAFSLPLGAGMNLRFKSGRMYIQDDIPTTLYFTAATLFMTYIFVEHAKRDISRAKYLWAAIDIAIPTLLIVVGIRHYFIIGRIVLNRWGSLAYANEPPIAYPDNYEFPNSGIGVDPKAKLGWQASSNFFLITVFVIMYDQGLARLFMWQNLSYLAVGSLVAAPAVGSLNYLIFQRYTNNANRLYAPRDIVDATFYECFHPERMKIFRSIANRLIIIFAITSNLCPLVSYYAFMSLIFK